MSTNNIFNLIKAIKTPAPTGVMQIGASYGQELELFRSNNVKSIVMVEPLLEPFSYISELCQKTPGCLAINALCSDIPNQSVKFHVASNGGQSSSLLKPENHLKIFDYVKFENVIDLKTTTVDLIFEYLLSNEIYSNIASCIDTLYMDVQGAEYKVLLGSVKFLKNINYIYFELIRGDLYADLTDLSSYIFFLKTQGFVINNLNFNEYHHSDVLFVRESILKL